MEETVLQLEELLFPSIADIAVLSIDVNDEAVLIEARCTLVGADCVGCMSWSERVHSSYMRYPADVPSAGSGFGCACGSAGSSAGTRYANGRLSSNRYPG